jgi:voltage-gated potassium channel
LQIIARASEEEATRKLLRAGATQVLSPYFFVGRRIAELFLRPNVLDFVDTAFGTERLDIEIGEVKIPEHSVLAGKKMADSMIRREAGVIVLAVKNEQGKMAFNPSEDSVIRVGDCLIVVGGDDRLKKLEALARAQPQCRNDGVGETKAPATRTAVKSARSGARIWRAETQPEHSQSTPRSQQSGNWHS